MTATQTSNARCLSYFTKNSSIKSLLVVLSVSLAVTMNTSNAFGVVKFFDGFGDADLNNNGTALEPYDVDVGDSAHLPDPNADIPDPNQTNTNKFWTPGRITPIDPNNPPQNAELTSVEDAGDVGLRWIQMRGFTGGDQRSKPTARIANDNTGAMLETTAVGPEGALGRIGINSGNALTINSRGGGSSIAAFFDESVALGANEGDSLKVSFDFRVWADASSANAQVVPEAAELRFGLYQDTDSQLGLSNPITGRGALKMDGTGYLLNVPAVWGQEEGRFEGGQILGFIPGSEIGATGDKGFFGAVSIEDPAGIDKPPAGGLSWRIREEDNVINASSSNDQRILQGNDTDTVALPDPNNPGLTNLSTNKVYRLSLELVRGISSITAHLSAYDINDPNTVFTLSGSETIIDPDPNAAVPVSPESFDYFAMRNTRVSATLCPACFEDDWDFVIDNFMLETFSAPANADFDGNGFVDGLDFLKWQRGETPGNGSQAELALWEAQYGGPPPLAGALAAVPEPTSALLALLGLIGISRVRLGAGRSRRRQ